MNGVYCLTFPNGKRYVGKSVYKTGNGIERRWYCYKSPNPKYPCMGRKLLNALLHYGPENVKFEVIIETDDDDRAMQIEKQLVALWNLRSSKFGYNHLEGGLPNNMKGRTFTMPAEARERIRKHNLGKKATPEARRNMSLAHKGVWTKPLRILKIMNTETGQIAVGGVKELSRLCGVSAQHISTRGKSKGWIVIEAEPKCQKFGNCKR